MAKVTFAQGDEELQSRAIFRAWQVLQNMGFSNPNESFEKMPEVEKCAVIAYAFAELDIAPPFPKESWQFVPRPFVDIINADTAFSAAQRHLKRTYGVDVSF